jgi:hypothetical protein
MEDSYYLITDTGAERLNEPTCALKQKSRW